MKFRTRLLITSVTIVLLPLLLTCAALLVVGSHIEDVETPSDFFDRDNVSYIYTVETYSRISEEVLEKVRRQIEEDPSRLEDKDYLDEIASDLKDKSSYIIIRKNDMLSYTSNNGDAKKIFPALPEYGNEMPGSEAGYYYSDIRKLVKKVDFCFSDGAEGSFFRYYKCQFPAIQKDAPSNGICFYSGIGFYQFPADPVVPQGHFYTD